MKTRTKTIHRRTIANLFERGWFHVENEMGEKKYEERGCTRRLISWWTSIERDHYLKSISRVQSRLAIIKIAA